VLLYKSMVRSHFFSNSMWSPYKVGLTDKIKKVQQRATKLIPSCKGFAYSERLKVLGIPTLKYRHYRGDMIETIKFCIVFMTLQFRLIYLYVKILLCEEITAN